MKPTVALIYGGEGYEREISILCAKNLSTMIDREKYELVPVLIDENGEWSIDGIEGSVFPVFTDGIGGLISKNGLIKIDIAIPLLHGDKGEDGAIVGALKSAHVRFIGCDVLPSAIASDKISAKLIATALKIPTADWIFSIDQDCDGAILRAEQALSYPMFVKPSELGSSIGISKAYCRDELRLAYGTALKYSKRILIEKAVSVKSELECAYLTLNGKHVYKVGEVLSDGSFYDFDRKYNLYTKTSAELMRPDIEKAVTDAADKLREAIGAYGIARFDFFLTEDEKIVFNEINTFPGMTKTSLYPLLTRRMGLLDGEFINRLIAEALI